MPVESAADRAVFVNGAEFGETVLWTVGDDDPLSISVLAQVGDQFIPTIDGPDVQGQEASFVMPASCLPLGAAERAGDEDGVDVVLFRAQHCRVKTVAQDGTGMALVRLERIGNG